MTKIQLNFKTLIKFANSKAVNFSKVKFWRKNDGNGCLNNHDECAERELVEGMGLCKQQNKALANYSEIRFRRKLKYLICLDFKYFEALKLHALQNMG